MKWVVGRYWMSFSFYLGFGTISWEPLISSLLSADVDLFVMEHDKPNDIKRFATRSIESFKKMRELYE